MPAFQRAFVWKEKQIIELLESVYRGFPIGSLLFWRVNDPILRVENEAESVFPPLKLKYPLSYVLDGLQRLSALYAVFHHTEQSEISKFNVLFDLDKEEFILFDPSEVPEHHLRLSDLFSPKAFLASQARLSETGDADILLERAINLHSTFQQYLVPTVTISDRPVSEVVSMFERINSTGTRLNAVDFMRAITWSEDFDLNTQIDYLEQVARRSGFEIPPETFVKMMSVVLGKPPVAEQMLTLRELPPSVLKRATMDTEAALLRTLKFLAQRFGILSYEFVPYEGQMLILAKLFGALLNDSDNRLDKVESWFWTVSLNEEYRGKPDHFIARTLNRAQSLIDGQMDAISERLSLTAADLMERRFIKGKALSGAIASLFAVSKARSIMSGVVIPAERYMSEFSPSNYEAILGLNLLPSNSTRSGSSKLLANIVAVGDEDVRLLRNQSVFDAICTLRTRLPNDANAILRSQLLPEDADVMLKQSVEKFLEARAETMLQSAKSKIVP